MSETMTSAAGERIAGPELRPGVAAQRTPPGRRLVDGPTAAAKIGCSYRHFLRLADGGKAPSGVKLGALRRWDLDELDAWIANGCPTVRRAGGVR